MATNELIKKFFSDKQLNITAVAEATGLAYSTVSSIFNNADGSPSMKTLQKLQHAFPDLTINNETSLDQQKRVTLVNRERAMVRVLWRRWAKFEAEHTGVPLEEVLNSMDADTILAWRELG
ncbi:hypothetical protein DCC81_24695 [Chitinophaga parva]|uniref:HTH cro/C1-type domain-containing protein n=1 Tax=Chitinophaga parva TaxID=2169414 RepID=A0A2T7BBM9_9BACT|nr:helix-turn-helix transcriptional regulator [Chitinophaga parva]PUZ21790.1 hypothetical protein DCC81_24695 [Chitinophaga parva]